MEDVKVQKVTRYQIERYKVIDRLLHGKYNKFTMEEILKRVNAHMKAKYGKDYRIKRRMLDNDIRAMRELIDSDLKIVAKTLEGHTKYMHYDREDKTLFNTQLTSEDIQSLQEIIKSLAKYRNIDDTSRIDHMLLKLEQQLGVEKLYRTTSEDEEVVSFEHNTEFESVRFLDDIIEATTRHKKIIVMYEPFGKKERIWHVHPWYVKQFNRRWFLIGHVDEIADKTDIVNLALDRIQSFSIEGNPEIKYKYRPADLVQRFKKIIGVSLPTGDEEPQDVVLRFDQDRFPYVKTKPIHEYQELDEEKCEVRLHVYINNELKQMIYSFGSQVEVISPESLRQECKENFKKTLEKYL